MRGKSSFVTMDYTGTGVKDINQGLAQKPNVKNSLHKGVESLDDDLSVKNIETKGLVWKNKGFKELDDDMEVKSAWMDAIRADNNAAAAANRTPAPTSPAPTPTPAPAVSRTSTPPSPPITPPKSNYFRGTTAGADEIMKGLGEVPKPTESFNGSGDTKDAVPSPMGSLPHAPKSDEDTKERLDQFNRNAPTNRVKKGIGEKITEPIVAGVSAIKDNLGKVANNKWTKTAALGLGTGFVGSEIANRRQDKRRTEKGAYDPSDARGPVMGKPTYPTSETNIPLVGKGRGKAEFKKGDTLDSKLITKKGITIPLPHVPASIVKPGLQAASRGAIPGAATGAVTGALSDSDDRMSGAMGGALTGAAVGAAVPGGMAMAQQRKSNLARMKAQEAYKAARATGDAKKILGAKQQVQGTRIGSKVNAPVETAQTMGGITGGVAGAFQGKKEEIYPYKGVKDIEEKGAAGEIFEHLRPIGNLADDVVAMGVRKAGDLNSDKKKPVKKNLEATDVIEEKGLMSPWSRTEEVLRNPLTHIVTGSAVGGTTGVITNQEDRKRGALVGGIAGGIGGGVGGVAAKKVANKVNPKLMAESEELYRKGDKMSRARDILRSRFHQKKEPTSAEYEKHFDKHTNLLDTQLKKYETPAYKKIQRAHDNLAYGSMAGAATGGGIVGGVAGGMGGGKKKEKSIKSHALAGAAGLATGILAGSKLHGESGTPNNETQSEMIRHGDKLKSAAPRPIRPPKPIKTDPHAGTRGNLKQKAMWPIGLTHTEDDGVAE